MFTSRGPKENIPPRRKSYSYEENWRNSPLLLAPHPPSWFSICAGNLYWLTSSQEEEEEEEEEQEEQEEDDDEAEEESSSSSFNDS